MSVIRHLIAGAAFSLALAAPAPLTAFAQSPAPLLVDQTGRSFTLDGLRRTPVVLTFVSAHCVDTCPIINAQFESMQRQVQHSKLPIRLVTITLDPRHDRLADMQRLAKTFDANPRYWMLAWAPVGTIQSLMRRFNVTASRGNRDYDDIHTTFVYLLDTHGRLVKTMLASTNLPADLFAELQRNWNKLDV